MRGNGKSLDEYLSGIDPAFRAELERIRTIVTRLAPDTEETFSYGMPTITYKNQALAYFTASKNHMSFYPSSWANEELQDQLTQYKTTKHAIQFTLAQTLPSSLIEDLIRVHVRKIDADRK